MKSIFDSEYLEITCPNCKGKIRRKVRDFKRAGNSCPKCGLKFDTTDFKKGLDKVDKQMTDFSRQLKKMRIDIKL